MILLYRQEEDVYKRQILDSIGSAPQVRFCQDRTAMVLTVESGESTAILPQSIASRLQADNLHILHFHHASAKLYLLAAWRREGPTPLARHIAQRTLEALHTK